MWLEFISELICRHVDVAKCDNIKKLLPDHADPLRVTSRSVYGSSFN